MKITVSQPNRKQNKQPAGNPKARQILIPEIAGWRAGEIGTVLTESEERIVVDFGDGVTAGYPRSLFEETPI